MIEGIGVRSTSARLVESDITREEPEAEASVIEVTIQIEQIGRIFAVGNEP